MKKWRLRVFMFSTAFGLLSLTGCDTPVGDGIWLDDVANPFIGTWTTTSTSMMGVVTITERKFKTDGTVDVTTTVDAGAPSQSTVYYLVKNNTLILSTTGNPAYTKYRFSVIDNNSIRLTQDITASTTTHIRVGPENQNADRTINLNNNLNGYWRWSLNHGASEGAMFMYDWWTIGTDGTYHAYHYMNKNKHYLDRGEFSYYFDSGNDRLVALSDQNTVTVYTTSSVDLEGSGKFQLEATGITTRKYERFDGETFWESGHTTWE